jgi:hypothetical protein
MSCVRMSCSDFIHQSASKRAIPTICGGLGMALHHRWVRSVKTCFFAANRRVVRSGERGHPDGCTYNSCSTLNPARSGLKVHPKVGGINCNPSLSRLEHAEILDEQVAQKLA